MLSENGLLAVNHYDVNELSQQLRSELGIRQDFTLTNNATSWHFSIPRNFRFYPKLENMNFLTNELTFGLT